MPVTPVLVALDVGRITGWAMGPIDSKVPTCGSWELPKADLVDEVGARVVKLTSFLDLAFARWHPWLVVMAEPVRARSMTEAASMLALYGVVRASCWKIKVRPRVQPENTVRKEMLGRGMGPSWRMKELAQTWCQEHHITALDEHAADAAVMWAWTLLEVVKEWPARVAVPQPGTFTLRSG